jgi:hypothetical protein
VNTPSNLISIFQPFSSDVMFSGYLCIIPPGKIEGERDEEEKRGKK